jgi:hypothetical protein
VWHFTPVIPALRRQRQEEHEFKASLGLQSENWSQNKTNKQKKSKENKTTPKTNTKDREPLQKKIET